METNPRPPGNRIVPDGLHPIGIVGVTASGKSWLALDLARERPDVEIVSIDSMQVYRHLDIGTAKPTREERAEVPHHLIDVVDPWDDFDLSTFQQLVGEALTDIHRRGRRALLVGGTGLYLRAVVDALDIPGRYPEITAQLETEPDTTVLHRRLQDLDPLAASRIEPGNRRRILRALSVTIGSGRPFSSHGPGLDAHPPSPVRLIGIHRERDDIRTRIRNRFHQQMDDGFLDEVIRLLDAPPLSRTASQALGYRELLEHLALHPSTRTHDTRDEEELQKTVELAITRTCQFAIRQERWFRRDPRIEWVEPADAARHLRRLARDLWS